ncbi:unnamed protein product [Sphagnum troendelagicum]|uniref:Uncharacterized protein n=1 Tax=Sphagnum troendelagicum TaxID=128251 RepID=A0ABP0U219_9BRYO
MGRWDHECGWQTSIFILTVVQQELCADVDPFHVAWETCSDRRTGDAQGCASYDLTAPLSGWSQSGISRRLSWAGCIQETVRCRNDFAPCDEARFS